MIAFLSRDLYWSAIGNVFRFIREEERERTVGTTMARAAQLQHMGPRTPLADGACSR